MKCIHCQNDSRYRDRVNGKCPKCGERFAFEPRNGDPFTDMAFKRAIDRVSSEGQVRWGVEHLYYELCRRKRVSPAIQTFLVSVAVTAAVVSLVAGIMVHPTALLGLIIAGLFGLLALGLRSDLVNLDRDKFSHLYDVWVRIHGAPASVIIRKDAPKPAKAPEPDVADYSFDRAVICDRARTADLLLANHFHFENNCAVLSIDGYPAKPFEVVRAMLKRNPRLAVYALHDATPAGCRLAEKLATDPDWFAGQTKVIDVGLRPIHGQWFRGLLLSATQSDVVAEHGISEWEAKWLSKYRLELAAMRPEHVLKRLFRAMNLPINMAELKGDVVYLPPRSPRESGAGGNGSNGGADGGAYVVMSSDAGGADGTGDADGAADSFG